jgi:hypothetical protein
MFRYIKIIIVLLSIVIFLLCLFLFIQPKIVLADDNSLFETGWIEVFPVAGVLGEDLRRINSYYDHDPEEATIFNDKGMGKNNILDYMGGDRTYDGHAGTDISIVSFEWQDTGIPIIAVAPGVVMDTQDGYYDYQLDFVRVEGNYVLIDHGSGRCSYYGHLKKYSVCVQIGDRVEAGQQIGMIGSSGRSTWPHLHFECREDDKKIDPFSGPYNPIPSRWKVQPEYSHPMVIVDWGLYYKEDEARSPFVPERQCFVQRGKSKEENLKLWIEVLNVEEKPYTRTWKLISPNKSYINEFVSEIDGSKEWHGLGAIQWRYTYNMSFSEKASIGCWSMEIYHNDEFVKILTFDVCDNQPQNRPPMPPQNASLWPESPETRDVVISTVNISLYNLDPDLDKERYHFKWLLNGILVRDVVNATRRDYFPANCAESGDILECFISTSDGQLESPALLLTAVYR